MLSIFGQNEQFGMGERILRNLYRHFECRNLKMFTGKSKHSTDWCTFHCAYADTLAHCIADVERLLLELCQLSWEISFPVTETFLKAWSCCAVNQHMCQIYYFIHIYLKAFKDGIMNWDKIRTDNYQKQIKTSHKRKNEATLLKELQACKTILAKWN